LVKKAAGAGKLLVEPDHAQAKDSVVIASFDRSIRKSGISEVGLSKGRIAQETRLHEPLFEHPVARQLAGAPMLIAWQSKGRRRGSGGGHRTHFFLGAAFLGATFLAGAAAGLAAAFFGASFLTAIGITSLFKDILA
jgi:hypothetical protein